MPYIKKEFETIKGKKIEDFLIEDISIDSKLTLNLLEKGKITDENNKRLQKNQTLVEASPLTGRQHQIRVHLNSIGHKIVGDPIYGIEEKIADLFLKNKLSEGERLEYTKANRLLLQANYLEFEFLDVIYKFSSRQEF